MMRTAKRLVPVVALSVVAALPPAARAQLPTPSATVTGTAGSATALVRGYAAVATNPAALGLPGSSGFSVSLPSLLYQQALGPVSLGDVRDYEGAFLPDSRKEEWLRRIASAGGETGQLAVHSTWLAANVGRMGVQVSTVAFARARMNEDAAELLLFGNAGRTGTPGDFDLAGSRLDALALSTVGVSYALPVGLSLTDAPEQHAAVGATLKYTVGHALLLARDAGSLVRSDPVGVDVRFPMIHTDTTGLDPNGGSGVGLDLGAMWESESVVLALALQNVFHTFSWDLDGMFYRPAEAYFDEADTRSDFDARPAAEAPEALRREVERFTFRPRLAAGAAWRPRDGLALTADVERRFGDGIPFEPKSVLALGGAYGDLGPLVLRGGLARITDGYRVGGGAGLRFAGLRLDAAALLQRGNVGDGTLFMLTLAYGGI